MIIVREIDPFDEELFETWYGVLRAGALADRPTAIVVTLEALAYSLRNPTRSKTRLAVAAFDEDLLVGAMLFEYRLEDNLDTVEVEIDVPVEERRRGVGTALWSWASARAVELGRTIFQTELGVPVGHTSQTWPGSLLAAKLGFTVEHVEDHYVVPLPYDEARLQRIRQDAGELEGYRLTSWSGVCPAEHLAEYVELHTAMDHDVPTGGMTREVTPWTVERLLKNEQRVDKNYLALVTMAHTLDGDPAGYTLMYLPRSNPEHVQQDDTLVLREHRGHNLGTQLKLANLDLLVKHLDGQQWLHTWTAESNGPMQKVNTRFGFNPVEKHQELERTAPSPLGL